MAFSPEPVKEIAQARFETALLQRAANNRFTNYRQGYNNPCGSTHRVKGQGRGRYFFWKNQLQTTTTNGKTSTYNNFKPSQPAAVTDQPTHHPPLPISSTSTLAQIDRHLTQKTTINNNAPIQSSSYKDYNTINTPTNNYAVPLLFNIHGHYRSFRKDTGSNERPNQQPGRPFRCDYPTKIAKLQQ